MRAVQHRSTLLGTFTPVIPTPPNPICSPHPHCAALAVSMPNTVQSKVTLDGSMSALLKVCPRSASFLGCKPRGRQGGDPKRGNQGEKMSHAQHHSWVIPLQGHPGLCLADKPPTAIISGSKSDSPLDSICLSASEKAAVLTLIREEVKVGDAL